MVETERPKDKYAVTWNEDLIKLSNRAKRLANEIILCESNRQTSGIMANIKKVGDIEVFTGDLGTIIDLCDLIKSEALSIKRGYFPTTHDSISFKALLADLSHPEAVQPHEEPEEPNAEPKK